MGYRERHELSHQNALTILHHVTQKKGAKPKRIPPTPYKNWNKSQINYLALEKQLAGFSAGDPADPPAESGSSGDNGDDESEDEDGSVGGYESE